jgi:hypothetical protein
MTGERLPQNDLERQLLAAQQCGISPVRSS